MKEVNPNNKLATDILSNDSRYLNNLNVVDNKGKYMYKKPYKQEYDPTTSSKEVVMNDMVRLDTVAYDYYKNPRVYYTIADASNIDNPMKLAVGSVLTIPKIVV